jgi:bifunctional non-homologous end joining protein LigD
MGESPLRPMLARTAEQPPEGEGWGFEIKWDGVRVLAHVEGSELRLESRTGEDVTARYPELAGIAAALTSRSATLDGEIVALDEQGRPSFQRLQARMGLTSRLSIQRRVTETPVTYMAFDLLRLEDRPLIELPYEERRRLLEGLGVDGPHWQTPRYHVGDGGALLQATRERGLEGLVAKRLDSPYRPGKRSGEWVKVPNLRRQELVVGGWMRGEGGRSGGVGSLLVGYWDATPEEARSLGRDQRFVFAGGVGTGFTQRMLRELKARLEPLRRETSPFAVGGPKRPAQALFCEPEVVCEVEFKEWTREQTLRAASFNGLRYDKDPREVVRE